MLRVSFVRLGVLLSVGCLLVACSGGGNTSLPAKTSLPTSSLATTVRPPVSSPTASAPSLPVTTYQFNLKTPDGYQEAVTLELGQPRPASQWIQAPGSACQINAQKDEVVPFTVTMRNTTPDFSYQVSFDLRSATVDTSLYLEVEAGGSGSCNTHFGYDTTEGRIVTVSSTGELSTGQSAVAYGLVGYSNYRSPAGDQAAKLADVFLMLGPASQITDLTGGPSVHGPAGGVIFDAVFVPLDGHANGCTASLNSNQTLAC